MNINTIVVCAAFIFLSYFWCQLLHALFVVQLLHALLPPD
jgi:hypothetical protein